jgi:hypothetical protein
MNVATDMLATFTPMVDTVNDRNLWGMPPRCIKLSNVPWSRKLYSLCTFFRAYSFQFDVNFESFDRDLADEGTRILGPNGDPFNPEHFIAYKDASGELAHVVLDGSGNAWTGLSANAKTITLVTNTPNPIIQTSTNHGWNAGQQVIVKGVQGAILVNGVWTILSVPNPNQFDITLATSPGVYIGGTGKVADVDSATDPGNVHAEFYDESNLLLLGIPSTL